MREAFERLNTEDTEARRHGGVELIMNAPSDYYWGCGADGSGKNMLGRILMEVRAILRERQGG
jgi:predicted NAD-dependent protein-ADP-ribosyltransferase YbiA (DUF1768 family)